MAKAVNYKRYPAEFKKMALIKTTEEGVSDRQVAEELGISARQLLRWRDEFRLKGDKAFVKKETTKDKEIKALEKEIEELKQERDFLKKAVVFFAKESD